jgi:hypothetical protein
MPVPPTHSQREIKVDLDLLVAYQHLEAQIPGPSRETPEGARIREDFAPLMPFNTPTDRARHERPFHLRMNQ